MFIFDDELGPIPLFTVRCWFCRGKGKVEKAKASRPPMSLDDMRRARLRQLELDEGGNAEWPQ